MTASTEVLQGTLDLLILKTLALQPMHGWGIAQRIRQVSQDVLQDNQAARCPALHRVEQQGWIRAKWENRKIIAAPSSMHSPQTAPSICARSKRNGSGF